MSDDRTERPYVVLVSFSGERVVRVRATDDDDAAFRAVDSLDIADVFVTVDKVESDDV